MSLIKFTKVHMGSDKTLILKSNVEEHAFLRIGREDYFKNLLATTNCYEKARMVGVPREMLQDTKVKGKKEIASFQIDNGGERRHVMCVGARSGSNPGPLGSEPSALTNCASCPLPL